MIYVIQAEDGIRYYKVTGVQTCALPICRMLFVGLGTGMGTGMIIDRVVAPMELGHLPYRKGKSFEEFVGTRGLERLGKKKWRGVVEDVVGRLQAALIADYVVLGGGNVKKLDRLPPGTRPGD